MKQRHSLKKTGGFTLIELVVVIMVISIIAAIGSRILSQSFSNYFKNKNLVESDWQPRIALERMQRDIRSVRSPSDISTATATSFVFVDTDGNTIAYSLSGTSLMHQINGGTAQVLADGIQSLTFAYFDLNGNTTAVLANIRFIQFSLNVTQNSTNYVVTSGVYGRNLP
ncbi:MAG: prepilin-type N-terminal cleavage/methylation domain-containing protein [Gammaproteobacteria bacterium]|nr:prepilin-type N-terminal cleavage/methylation domain-containing protein [Gammaproteobacteria bacterium]